MHQNALSILYIKIIPTVAAYIKKNTCMNRINITSRPTVTVRYASKCRRRPRRLLNSNNSKTLEQDKED